MMYEVDVAYEYITLGSETALMEEKDFDNDERTRNFIYGLLAIM